MQSIQKLFQGNNAAYRVSPDPPYLLSGGALHARPPFRLACRSNVTRLPSTRIVVTTDMLRVEAPSDTQQKKPVAVYVGSMPPSYSSPSCKAPSLTPPTWLSSVVTTYLLRGGVLACPSAFSFGLPKQRDPLASYGNRDNNRHASG